MLLPEKDLNGICPECNKKVTYRPKTRIEHVMLKFLATTENIRKIRSEDSNYSRGIVVKNSIGKMLFAISNT